MKPGRKNANAPATSHRRGVLPQENQRKNTRTSGQSRHDPDETTLKCAINQAVRKARAVNRVACHTFGYFTPAHLLQTDCDIRTIQDLYRDKYIVSLAPSQEPRPDTLLSRIALLSTRTFPKPIPTGFRQNGSVQRDHVRSTP
jgi:hypothetical protein